MINQAHIEMAEAVKNIIYGPEDGNYFPALRAFCKNNKDPLKQGRIQVYIPSLNGPIPPDLDAMIWASPCLPSGGSSKTGSFTIPDVDSSIWILFEAGSTLHPFYFGSWHGENEMPEETYEGESPSSDFVYAREDLKIRAKRDNSELAVQFDKDTVQTFTADSIILKRKDALVTLAESLISLEVGETKISMDGTNIVLSTADSSIQITPAVINILSDVVNLAKQVNITSA